jgi:hypothetical protein
VLATHVYNHTTAMIAVCGAHVNLMAGALNIKKSSFFFVTV